MDKPLHSLVQGDFNYLYEEEYGRLLVKASESDQFEETLFWAFVKMRQNAWARRAMGWPKPWTGDAIINEWRFTNIYRELDRGTLYLVENVLEKCDSRQSAIFLSALYRCFNRPETWERLVKHCTEDQGRKFVDLEDMYVHMCTTGFTDVYSFFAKHHNHKDYKLFTGAYQMTSMVKMFYEGEIVKLHNACMDISAIETITIEQATRRLAAVPYLGMFSAFQVAMDICIPTLRNRQRPWAPVGKDALDSWVAVGPGSKAGSALIRSDLNASTLIRYLRENQFIRLASLGGDPFPAPIRNDKPQTLRIIDIEHALCEFAKYMNAMKGGRMKSKLSTPATKVNWTPSAPVPPSWGNAYGRRQEDTEFI